MHPHFSGVFVALMTPYTESHAIDWPVFEEYVQWLCQQGIQGLVPCGTTGDFPALSRQERYALIKKTSEIAAGKMMVIAGASGITTGETIQYIEDAEEAGASAVLLLTPYYLSYTGVALGNYYRDIHAATRLPMIPYLNPKRTGKDIDQDQLEELVRLDRIVALKDSSLNFGRVISLSGVPGFSLLSGDDGTFLPFLASGGKGIISVLSGLVPHTFLEIFAAWQQGKHQEALRVSREMERLVSLMRCGASPLLLKYGYELLGFGRHEHSRLLRDTLSPEQKDAMGRALKDMGANIRTAAH